MVSNRLATNHIKSIAFFNSCNDLCVYVPLVTPGLACPKMRLTAVSLAPALSNKVAQV